MIASLADALVTAGHTVVCLDCRGTAQSNWPDFCILGKAVKAIDADVASAWAV